MAYVCPVCEAPQRDGEHLANHLAFTAVIRGGDHEAWLDEHVPDWADRDPESLAPEVTDHADETEVPELSGEDVEGHAHERAAERPDVRDVDLDPETEAVLEEARALTARMLADDEADNGKG